jgi:hypothetical protein
LSLSGNKASCQERLSLSHVRKNMARYYFHSNHLQEYVAAFLLRVRYSYTILPLAIFNILLLPEDISSYAN